MKFVLIIALASITTVHSHGHHSHHDLRTEETKKLGHRKLRTGYLSKSETKRGNRKAFEDAGSALQDSSTTGRRRTARR
jgi:hypothetical protein